MHPNQHPYPAPEHNYQQDPSQSEPPQQYFQSTPPPPQYFYQQVPPQQPYQYQTQGSQPYSYQPQPASYQQPRQFQYPQLSPSPQPPLYYPQGEPRRQPLPQPAGPLKLALRGTGQKHVDKIIPVNGRGPAYTVTYNRHTFTSGPVITITGDHPLHATCDYHSFSSKIDIVLDGRGFTLKDDFDSAHGAGRLFWKLEGKPRTGVLRLDDRTGACLCTFGLKYDKEGTIEIWRQGLGQGLLDETVVTLLAQVESVRRQLADSNNAGLYGALAGAQAAGF